VKTHRMESLNFKVRSAKPMLAASQLETFVGRLSLAVFGALFFMRRS
jgi:hypothetical protein